MHGAGWGSCGVGQRQVAEASELHQLVNYAEGGPAGHLLPSLGRFWAGVLSGQPLYARGLRHFGELRRHEPVNL